jgi:hypothetical protein
MYSWSKNQNFDVKCGNSTFFWKFQFFLEIPIFPGIPVNSVLFHNYLSGWQRLLEIIMKILKVANYSTCILHVEYLWTLASHAGYKFLRR